ncbi:MAG: glutamine-hydrolyzing carbamoyl-phosphate synthase small subunit [Actinomycetota bacterium]|nr:glutamine-hydrolyzing carbamoyl-phosphate synthase small subunit [Actinomycetota bacterium]
MKAKAILALEDGTVFRGFSYGAPGETTGEVVFNTSMIGYQEILTDPSYAGQIVTMTYPMIGNYGVNEEDDESNKIWVSGFVVREGVGSYSNWRATGGLEDRLKREGIVGIQEIDTRALTKRIRTVGAMRGIISSTDLSPAGLVAKANGAPGLLGQELVRRVTAGEAYEWQTGSRGKNRFKVVAIDYGIKTNILRSLEKIGCSVTVLPATASREDVLSLGPDGIFLSNGPGDPGEVEYAIRVIKELLGVKPIFGICLGHQLLALALGAKTYKLKFGHRGGNQPVKNLVTGRVEITAQNHGYAVDPDSLPGQVDVTHMNLNDGTNEGLRCRDIPAFSVQYHPESAPGPHDSLYLFKEFTDLMGGQGV